MKKYPRRSFWISLVPDKELMCTRRNGYCYWEEIVWGDEFHYIKDLTREEARKVLEEWKQGRGK